MVETFVININCSKILDVGDETQYTMFIDSTKMSIVFELVEWIRWMFSRDDCLYLTYGDSVIHELEDIQILSKLRFFEVKPCGRSQCVHKKMYRDLLKNLDLFVYWNGVKIHKYFLHKINLMDLKISEEDSIATPLPSVSKNQSFMDYKKNDDGNNMSPVNNKTYLCDRTLPEAGKRSLLLKKRTLIENLESKLAENNLHRTGVNSHMNKMLESFSNNSKEKFGLNHLTYVENENLATETYKTVSPAKIKRSSLENNFKASVEKTKNYVKPPSRKFVRPFSLGEMLSNIREDFEKQNSQFPKPSDDNSTLQEEKIEDEETGCKNSFISEDEIGGVKKRKRIRKRKKSKKQNLETEEPFLSFQNKTNPESSLDSFKSNTNVKPNHIRFEVDNEDCAMETDCFQNELKIHAENDLEIIKREMNSIKSTVFKSEPQNLKTPTIESNQSLSDLVTSPVKISENKAVCSFTPNEVTIEEKLIDLDDQSSNGGLKSNKTTKNTETSSINSDLSMLLSLKEKFKNAVVIERFY